MPASRRALLCRNQHGHTTPGLSLRYVCRKKHSATRCKCCSTQKKRWRGQALASKKKRHSVGGRCQTFPLVVPRRRIVSRIKGLRDIRTHGSLAREGTLTSVARDWHKIRGSASIMDDASSGSWDGRVENCIYKKGTARIARPFRTRLLHHDLHLGERIRKQQIESTQSLLEELRQALAEGIPVASGELRRLEARLAHLNTE